MILVGGLTRTKAVLVAGTASGGQVGFGDGTSIPSTPFAPSNDTHGSLATDPPEAITLGVTFRYCHTDATYFMVAFGNTSGGVGFSTISIGGNIYAVEGASRVGGSSFQVYRWTRQAALVNGTSYELEMTLP